MEIRIYDPELDFLGIVENQSSFIWRRKYSECGTFELHLPITKDNLNIVQLGRLVTYRGAGEAGVIEDIHYYDSESRHDIAVSGRFLPSYMARRLIRPTIEFQGTAEAAMRYLLSNAVAIPNVVIGDIKGYTETTDFQATYKNLLTYEEKLARSASLGFKMVPDFTAKTITFDVYKGIDRSRSQTVNPFVEFSDAFDNLKGFEYHVNDQLYKNVFYVGGEGEGAERIWEVVGDDTLTGLERREQAVDARQIRKEEHTEAEYRAMLQVRGQEAFPENNLALTYEGSAFPLGNFRYKTDYDLGDIVTIKKVAWGLSADLRITEIAEIYEHEIGTVSLVFGNPLPERIDWSDI